MSLKSDEFKKIGKNLLTPSLFILLCVVSSIILAVYYIAPTITLLVLSIILISLSILLLPPLYIFILKSNDRLFQYTITKSIIIILIAVALSLLTFNSICKNNSLQNNNNENTLTSHSYRGIITSVTYKRYYKRNVISFWKKNNKENYKQGFFFSYDEMLFHKGDIIEFSAKSKKLTSQNHHFTSLIKNKKMNISHFLIINKFKIIKKAKPPYRFFLKKKLLLTIDRLFSRESASIIKALYLGDKNYISKKIISAYRNSGSLHVLAASGLHVGILISILFLPLSLVMIPKKYINASALFLVFFYLYITGAPISLLRAAIMYSIFVFQSFLQTNKNVFNTIFITAIIILLIFPSELFSLGFQLSFSATFGILMLYKLYKKYLPTKLPYVSASLALTLSAQVFVLPIIAIHLQQINITGFITNLITIPGTYLTIVTSLCATVVSIVSFEIAQYISILTNYIHYFHYMVIQQISVIPGHFYIKNNTTVYIILLLCYMMLLLPVLPLTLFLRRKFIPQLILAVSIFSGWGALYYYHSTPKNLITYIKHNRGLMLASKIKNRLLLYGDLPDKRTLPKLIHYINHYGTVKIFHFLHDPDYNNIRATMLLVKKLHISRCMLASHFYPGKTMMQLFSLLKNEKIPVTLFKNRENIKIAQEKNSKQIYLQKLYHTYINGTLKKYIKDNNCDIPIREISIQ